MPYLAIKALRIELRCFASLEKQSSILLLLQKRAVGYNLERQVRGAGTER